MGIEGASNGMDSRQEHGTVSDSGSAPEPGIYVCQFFFCFFFGHPFSADRILLEMAKQTAKKVIQLSCL